MSADYWALSGEYYYSTISVAVVNSHHEMSAMLSDIASYGSTSSTLPDRTKSADDFFSWNELIQIVDWNALVDTNTNTVLYHLNHQTVAMLQGSHQHNIFRHGLRAIINIFSHTSLGVILTIKLNQLFRSIVSECATQSVTCYAGLLKYGNALFCRQTVKHNLNKYLKYFMS